MPQTAHIKITILKYYPLLPKDIFLINKIIVGSTYFSRGLRIFIVIVFKIPLI